MHCEQCCRMFHRSMTIFFFFQFISFILLMMMPLRLDLQSRARLHKIHAHRAYQLERTNRSIFFWDCAKFSCHFSLAVATRMSVRRIFRFTDIAYEEMISWQKKHTFKVHKKNPYMRLYYEMIEACIFQLR